MDKDIFVMIESVQRDNDQTDEMEMLLPGEYYSRNGKHFICYDEVNSETQQTTKNVVKIDPRSQVVQISRTGEASVRMVFEKKKETRSDYVTPFGKLPVGIFTRQLKWIETERELRLLLEYALEINGQQLSECRVAIKIRNRDSLNLTDWK